MRRESVKIKNETNFLPSIFKNWKKIEAKLLQCGTNCMPNLLIEIESSNDIEDQLIQSNPIKS